MIFPPELRISCPSLHFGSSTWHLRNIQNSAAQGDPVLSRIKASRLVTAVIPNLSCTGTWSFQNPDAQSTPLSDNIRIPGEQRPGINIFKSPLVIPVCYLRLRLRITEIVKCQATSSKLGELLLMSGSAISTSLKSWYCDQIHAFLLYHISQGETYITVSKMADDYK